MNVGHKEDDRLDILVLFELFVAACGDVGPQTANLADSAGWGTL